MKFACTEKDLIPCNSEGIRWLEKDSDYVLAKGYWQELGYDLSYRTWSTAHEYGYRYASILEGDRIVSSAGLWSFSEECWEVVAVSTLPSFQRRGYSKRLVAFVASHILKSGRLATCSTGDDNLAMIATARSAGFQPIPAEKVWWSYPDLPDF